MAHDIWALNTSPVPDLTALSDVLAEHRRVFVLGLGLDGEAWLQALGRAGLEAQLVPAQANVLACFEALNALADERSCSLLVVSDPSVLPGAGPSIADMVALGPQLGWRRVAFGGAPLVLVRGPGPAKRMRWLDSADASAMRSLFKTVFGHAMSPELWAWKYGQGHGMGLGLWQDGELVAHYGGVSRAVRVCGQPMLACQVCDVMVAGKARAALVRRGPLALLTEVFLELRVGHERAHPIAFGFPSDRHHGVGRAVGLYEAVDAMVCLSWLGPIPDSRTDWRWRARLVDPRLLRQGSADWRALERLWQAMAAAFNASLVGERSAAWLHWRYGLRPEVGYVLLMVSSRLTRRTMGAVVLRQHEGHVEILDLIGPPRSFATLIRAARQNALAAGFTHCQAWITASHAHLLAQGSEPSQTQPLGITVPAAAHARALAPAQFKHAWFLMSGDTDFR